MDLPDSSSLLLLMLTVNKVKQSKTVSLKLFCGDVVNVLHLTVGESC